MSYQRDTHFTESEFNRRFTRAVITDFSENGFVYYKKERFFERFFGAPVFTNGQHNAFAKFRRDVLAGERLFETGYSRSFPHQNPKSKRGYYF